jgi:hypothetical protein
MEPALDYRIDGTRHQVHITYRRQPDFHDWRRTMEAVFQDPEYRPGYDFVLDRSEIWKAATTDYIQNMVGFIDKQVSEMGTGRWAIVVSDVTSFGMGRMAEQLSGTGAIRTFRKAGDAWNWLAGCRAN